jgi:hypothetical protein
MSRPDLPATVALPGDEAAVTGLRLIGRSDAFRNAVTLITRIAATDATVLILGETGTGKEVAARAIHYLGRRRDAPFIAVNCGSLPDELIESQLFGHRRGAFTDAHVDQSGLLHLADHGTIFLDEIDSMSLKAQVACCDFWKSTVSGRSSRGVRGRARDRRSEPLARRTVPAWRVSQRPLLSHQAHRTRAAAAIELETIG